MAKRRTKKKPVGTFIFLKIVEAVLLVVVLYGLYWHGVLWNEVIAKNYPVSWIENVGIGFVALLIVSLWAFIVFIVLEYMICPFIKGLIDLNWRLAKKLTRKNA